MKKILGVSLGLSPVIILAYLMMFGYPNDLMTYSIVGITGLILLIYLGGTYANNK